MTDWRPRLAGRLGLLGLLPVPWRSLIYARGFGPLPWLSYMWFFACFVALVCYVGNNQTAFVDLQVCIIGMSNGLIYFRDILIRDEFQMILTIATNNSGLKWETNRCQILNPCPATFSNGHLHDSEKCCDHDFRQTPSIVCAYERQSRCHGEWTAIVGLVSGHVAPTHHTSFIALL